MTRNCLGKELTIRSLSLFRCKNARVAAAEKNVRRRVLVITQLGRVMIRVEDVIEVPLGNASLLSNLSHSLRSTTDIARFDTSSLELLSAVVEVSILDGFEKRTALGNLSAQVFARVGGNKAC
jgi:hypothetical protein